MASQLLSSCSAEDTPKPVLSPEEKAARREARLKKRRKKRIYRTVLWTVFLVSAAVFIFCIVDIIFTLYERKAARDRYEQMQSQYETELVTQSDGENVSEEPVDPIILDPSKWYADIALPADKKIDFDALRARNADVTGWITIEGTDIDYPILQAHGKDVVYLTHDIDGNASEHGTVCVDVRCSRDFSDRVTLIYGHNMKDGSMFAPIYQYYRDPKFFQADHRIHIYLDNAVLTYRVVAAYEYGYEHPLYYYDMTDDADFSAYCDIFLNSRDMKAQVLPVEIRPDDHLLTLITSTNVRADQRLFVQAVLVDGE